MGPEKAHGALERYYLEYENDPDFVAEGMAITVVEDALSIMRKKGLSRSNLASTMGVSRAQVSRLFNAPPNLTLRSIARLAIALGVKPVIRLDPDAREHDTTAQTTYAETPSSENTFPATETRGNMGKIKVLLVDDHPVVRERLRETAE